MNLETKDIFACRICSGGLQELFNFGEIAMTGVFLKDGKKVPRATVKYGICTDCGLNQLLNTYELKVLYGDTYGYESHLNSEMTNHLRSKARLLESKYLGRTQSSVLDIASNDGTFLSAFSKNISTVGIDPLIGVVSDNYPPNSKKIKNYFSAAAIREFCDDRKFDLVTSLSVFYDLDNPVSFANDVFAILKPEGIWHLEQSYLPTMVETLSFDTICHEHLTYFGATQLKKILEETGFNILEISLNDVNGGSIAITAKKKSKSFESGDPFLEHLIRLEKETGFLSGERLHRFFQDIYGFRENLLNLLDSYKSLEKTILGIGASTKGNMLIQFCELDSHTVEYISEINPRKFGSQTPGSAIPIIDQNKFLADTSNFRNSLAIVFPWHFKKSILKSFETFVSNGGSVLFPLPRIELVNV